MDNIPSQHPYIQAASQFSQLTQFCYYPNKAIRLLLSVSALSILFSSFPLLSFLLHSFHVYNISTLPMKLFGYTIDKNYMFLLCNGLLVFIVKNSGLVGNSHSQSGDNLYLNEEHGIKNGHGQQSVPDLSENKALDLDESKIVVMEVQEEQVIATGSLSLITVVGGENELLTMQEEEEDGFGLLSTEELNKRCDDFIRKMKEEIKFGAKQLITV
ncbi:hypothetical protein ACB098_06G081600 [Castanea mollissima]|uniref:DUF4408 domain-containing protein n=1 Tax=Castanea mollissima TaxID=60419 RepID=A0A8J4Q8S6_9ROSI|nr:hypothetical protein CMV_028137 [Castanea mollissima]